MASVPDTPTGIGPGSHELQQQVETLKDREVELLLKLRQQEEAFAKERYLLFALLLGSPSKSGLF
jgi:hypothetical protein